MKMHSKRGVLILVGLFLLVLAGNAVNAIDPLLVNSTSGMTGSDLSFTLASNCNIYINTGSDALESTNYVGYFTRVLAVNQWKTTGGITGTNLRVYLKFSAGAGSCDFQSGTITLRHNEGSTNTISFDAVSVGAGQNTYRRVSVDGSAYEQSGFCNLTKASGSYSPTILSTPLNWTIYSKEGSSWSFWNGTTNLSQALVMLNHSSGKYIIFENVTTSSVVDYNLSGILIINDTSIGINDTYWPILKNNLCLDETKNMTIKTPTSGTTLRKYNVTNGVLLNGSIAYSAAPTDIWTIPASLGFSQYVAGYKSALTIYEANDPRYFNQTVFFYANYTNITDNALIGGMNCSIWFSDWGNWTNMTNATSSGVYEFNRTFSRAGLYNWNVTCNETLGQFDWLMAGENITITNYSRADIFFYSPAADASVSKHSLFNITTGIICRDYHCGNMTAALDPLEVSDQYSSMSSAKEERTFNIVEIKESEVYPPWTMLALLLVGCTMIALLVGLSTLNHHEKAIILVFLSIVSFGFIIAQQPTITGDVVYDSATHLVNMTSDATPFFTLNNNTYNLSHYACLNNLQADQGCNVTWQINATGTAGNKYEFFAIFNSTTYSNLTNSTLRRNITIAAVCGNAICESGENCTACSGDCGVCAAPSASSGGTFACIPDWQCAEWSSCSGEKQTRTCKDAQCSGFMGGKPSEEKECVVLQNKPAENQKSSDEEIVKENIVESESILESPSNIEEGPEESGKISPWLYLAAAVSTATLFVAIMFAGKRRKKKKGICLASKGRNPRENIRSRVAGGRPIRGRSAFETTSRISKMLNKYEKRKGNKKAKAGKTKARQESRGKEKEKTA